MNRFVPMLFCVVAGLATSGCSFLLVKGPPDTASGFRGRAGQWCHTASNVPALDAAFGTVEVLGGVAHFFEPLVVSADPTARPGDPSFGEKKAIGPWLGGVLIGTGILHFLGYREGNKRIGECVGFLRGGRDFSPQSSLSLPPPSAEPMTQTRTWFR